MYAQYEKQNPPDFVTHLNYITCLNKLSTNLILECRRNIKNKILESKNLKKKTNLINLTYRSLQEEYKMISQNQDFAEVCVPWVAVKSYYLLFNIFIITKYLLTGEESVFNSSHASILKSLEGFIGNGELYFSQDVFNQVYTCDEINILKISSGYNLRFIEVDIKKRFQQVLKKLLDYKIENFKRDKKINNFRKKRDQDALKKFIHESNLNIGDFFHLYRIKSNYRDLEFLDKDISASQFSEFYNNYFGLTNNFYVAFIILINNLSKIRLGREIL